MPRFFGCWSLFYLLPFQYFGWVYPALSGFAGGNRCTAAGFVCAGTLAASCGGSVACIQPCFVGTGAAAHFAGCPIFAAWHAVLLCFERPATAVCIPWVVCAECAGHHAAPIFCANDLCHYAGDPFCAMPGGSTSLPGQRSSWAAIWQPLWRRAGHWGCFDPRLAAAAMRSTATSASTSTACGTLPAWAAWTGACFCPNRTRLAATMTPSPTLGLGVLLALAVGAAAAAAERRLHPLCLLRRHAALCGICAMLTIFAVSHTITANGVTLATLPLPGQLIQLCSVFRSSGRLFWPVYYLMMLAAFVGLCRIRGKQWLPAALVTGLAALQLLGLNAGAVAAPHSVCGSPAAGDLPLRTDKQFLGLRRPGGTAQSLPWMGCKTTRCTWRCTRPINDMTTNDPFAARYDAEGPGRPATDLRG